MRDNDRGVCKCVFVEEVFVKASRGVWQRVKVSLDPKILGFMDQGPLDRVMSLAFSIGDLICTNVKE